MSRELTVLTAAMLEAGQEVLRLAKDGFEVRQKADQSPVTSADLAADRILHQAVTTAFPDDGWLSEESPDDPRRLTTRRVWIVDPIDGTRAFARGRADYCLSAALVDAGRPVVAVIYNPATGEWFSATREQGLTHTRRPDAVHPPFAPEAGPLLLVNPSELRSGRFRAIDSQMHCRPIGSVAYSLALVAAGLADAAVMLDGGNEWDIVAGVLLVEAGGGRVTDSEGLPFTFNRPDLRVHGVRAVSVTLDPPLLAKLSELRRFGSPSSSSRTDRQPDPRESS